MSITVVILAGGKGTRMYSNKPKVLHPIGGKPMLSHVVERARAVADGKLVVVVGHAADHVRTAMGDLPVSWVEQVPQLGTGHAMQCAAPELPSTGHSLVLYGDVPLLSEATVRAMLALVNADELVLLTQHLADPTGYGRIRRNSAGDVEAIVEQKDATVAELAIAEINTGILLLPNQHLHRWLSELRNDNAQGEYYLTDLIGFAVRDGVAVRTLQPGTDWETLGVNNQLQRAALERHYQQQQATQLMTQGVTLLDPARIDVRGELQCGKDVQIDVNCVFIGKVVLGDNVSIGAHCVLQDCEIAAGTQVAPFSHLDGAKVGEGARIGPYARLRPGAVLAAQVHVGNFVEIKKSDVGVGSKVNHLTYIGDSSIGSGVNIGAGTVTCNYDGVNKFRTVIGDGAFIGSGSMLIAPVTIGAGATIGAGSTLSKDAPADQLTVARAKAVTVPGWSRPQKKQD